MVIITQIFLMIVLLSCTSCSTSGKVDETASLKAREDSKTSYHIPESFSAYDSIKKTSGVEREIALYKVIEDSISNGKMFLESENSIAAVHVLNYGAREAPFRTDLVALYKVALQRFVNVSKEMIKNNDCNSLISRLPLVEKFTPDNSSLITEIKTKCPAYKNYLFSDREILDIVFNKTDQEKVYEKKEYKDITQELDYIVAKNNYFPARELAVQSYIDMLASLKVNRGEFKYFDGVFCKDFSIDPNATSVEEYFVTMECEMLTSGKLKTLIDNLKLNTKELLLENTQIRQKQYEIFKQYMALASNEKDETRKNIFKEGTRFVTAAYKEAQAVRQVMKGDSITEEKCTVSWINTPWRNKWFTHKWGEEFEVVFNCPQSGTTTFNFSWEDTYKQLVADNGVVTHTSELTGLVIVNTLKEKFYGKDGIRGLQGIRYHHFAPGNFSKYLEQADKFLLENFKEQYAQMCAGGDLKACKDIESSKKTKPEIIKKESVSS